MYNSVTKVVECQPATAAILQLSKKKKKRDQDQSKSKNISGMCVM